MRGLVTAAALLALAACGQLPGMGGTTSTTTSTTSTTATFSKPDPSNPAANSSAQQASISSDQRAQLESLVRNYLDGVQRANASGMGPAPGFNDEITSLQPGADHRWGVNLNSGTAYRIIGACDNECSNVDIELLDPSNAVVTSDTLGDDIPIVNYTPTTNGRYTVRLIMRTCTVAPCFAGARVLTASAGGKDK